MNPAALTAVTLGTERPSNYQRSSQDPAFTKQYYLVESTGQADEPTHHIYEKQSVPDDAIIRGEIVVRTGLVAFSGPLRYFAFRPAQDEPSWSLSSIKAHGGSSQLSLDDPIESLAKGGRFAMAAPVTAPPPAAVEVGSSLPDTESHSEVGNDAQNASANDRTTGDEAPQQQQPTAKSRARRSPSPRLAQKFKRDTVQDTPATATRFMDVGATLTSPGTPARARTPNSPLDSRLPHEEEDHSFEIPDYDPKNLATDLLISNGSQQHQHEDSQPLDSRSMIDKKGSAVKEQRIFQNSQGPEIQDEDQHGENSPQSQYGTANQGPAAERGSADGIPDEAVVKQEAAEDEDMIAGATDTTANPEAPAPIAGAAQIQGADAGDAMDTSDETTDQLFDKDVQFSDSRKRKASSVEDDEHRISPKKKQKATDLHNASTPSVSALGKRRGRPSKEVKTVTESTTTPTPSRRGRPPKLSAEAPTAAAATLTPIPTGANRRGRPPKAAASSKEPTPQSSARKNSMRRGSVDTPTKTLGHGTRSLFSNAPVKERPHIMKSFKKLGAEITESHHPDAFDVLVVGQKDLKKIPKLLVAVAAGKPVVTDKWLTNSITDGRMLPMGKFVPSVQLQWGYKPADTSERNNLLRGKTIHVTPALKKAWGTEGYRDIELLAKTMGADDVVSKTTRGLQPSRTTVVLGQDKDDNDAVWLIDENVEVFNRDLLPYAALRGKLNWDSNEFRIERLLSQGAQSTKKGTRGQPANGAKRGRPRKNA